jgi:hypothetical protein
MFKKFIISSVVGGILLFIWSLAAYCWIPTFKEVSHTFKDQAAVEKVLAENVTVDGLYIFQESEHDAEAQAPSMPFASMNYMSHGKAFYGWQPYVAGFFISIFIAMFASFIMLMAKPMNYFGRMMFLTFVGFIGSFAIYVGLLNWMAFSIQFVIFEIVYWIIAFFLMSIPIAGLIKGKSCCSHDNHQ